MKNKSLSIQVFLSFVLFVTILSACKRNDDEPVRPDNRFARLYVSYSDYNTNQAAPAYPTMGIIELADSVGENGNNEDVFQFRKGVNIISGVKGGAAIYFDPLLRRVYQSSINNSSLPDTVLASMDYKLTGIPTDRFPITHNVTGSAKGITTFAERRYLYITKVQSGGAGTRDPNPFGIYRFNSAIATGYVRYGQKIELREELRPWGLAMRGKDLYVSKTGNDGGVMVFESIADNLDTLLTAANVNPRVYTIRGADNIRGISYNEKLDLLALTDYKESDGRILLIEKFSTLTAGDIVPTRIITGAETGLKQPIDVSLDRRADAVFLFVSDPASKLISRFKISDQGNVKPDVTRASPYTPAGLYFDGRD